MNTRTPLLACAFAALFLVLPPAFARADTPAVAVVRQFLADRAAGRYDAAYALLSASSQKAVLKEDFAAGPPPSLSAEIASAVRDLSTVAIGLGALVVDPHNTLR